jgi:hypothetical protein
MRVEGFIVEMAVGVKALLMEINGKEIKILLELLEW